MKKKYVSAILVLAVSLLWILPEPITRPFFHMVVLGIVPGTDIEMGLVLPFVLTCIALFFVVRWSREVTDAFIEYKTEIALKEEELAESKSLEKTGAAANELMDEEIEAVSI